MHTKHGILLKSAKRTQDLCEMTLPAGADNIHPEMPRTRMTATGRACKGVFSEKARDARPKLSCCLRDSLRCGVLG